MGTLRLAPELRGKAFSLIIEYDVSCGLVPIIHDLYFVEIGNILIC